MTLGHVELHIPDACPNWQVAQRSGVGELAPTRAEMLLSKATDPFRARRAKTEEKTRSKTLLLAHEAPIPDRCEDRSIARKVIVGSANRENSVRVFSTSAAKSMTLPCR
ncbi:hypothetical protein P153DRAFT_153364 [Dothidotthia symphoricarpi CBS 119687]|uniref:Uncharacterized protein n=1 Tax=Dothidotthia symphoricarpi CBS 119687 TaxID=1392245 RepID=A0A6A6AMQ4_9PLEO|nr:uncharacterized protein P153DRAFT_153364 [Dothidotthia symphoricarpi CBS 119687]KAF2133262.1 hypothetical protein P153DRAFT_153364 [Dothidotthia symphoricarpi CBS 119687]